MTIDTVERRKLFFCLGACNYSAVAKLIKKQLLIDNDIFFPENVAYEDQYWGGLIHFYVKKLYILEEKLYHYYVNEKSTVLKMSEDYHLDWLTVYLIKWKTWEERGFFKDFHEELEYEFLWFGYLGFMKLLALRYEKVPYSLFLLAKEMTLAHVSDYRRNKYADEGFTEFQKLVLQTLVLPIDKEQFAQILALIRKHGI